MVTTVCEGEGGALIFVGVAWCVVACLSLALVAATPPHTHSRCIEAFSNPRVWFPARRM